MQVVHILSFIVFMYVGLSVIYLFFFAIAGRFGKVKKYSIDEKKL